MKKLFYILSFILVSFIYSCTQETGIVYSCDESINDWTIDNLSKIHSMTRNEWINLDDVKKSAAYRAFTKKQKIDFWLEKLDEVKSLDWSTEELLHIESIILFIKEHQDYFSYTSLTDEQADELYRFCYLWGTKGMENFGWSKETIISIICTGDTVINKQGGTRKSKSTPPYGSDKIDCYCHAGNILFSTCIGPGEYCGQTKCNISFGGCGLFLMEECNGTCI